MIKKLGVVLAILFSQLLYSQEFIAKNIPASAFPQLSQKFKAFEVIELDVASIQASLNARSSQQHLVIKNEAFNWDLSLTENDIFSKNFYLSVGTDHGVEKRTDRAGIRTFKALSNAKRAGLSSLTLADHFIFGFIEEAGVKHHIEPLRYLDPSAGPDQFIVYNEQDVIPVPGLKCGMEEFQDAMHLGEEEIHNKPNAARAPCILVDIAIACDKTIYDNKGGVNQSEAFVTGVLNDVQTNYDNEFTTDIEFSISTIFVATTTGSDPWNGVNNINTHLDVHRSWANSGGYGGASYAVATAWTRKYTSGAIGLAWVGALCGSYRYNVCSDFGGGAGLLRCLQAHELGHNFNAIHDGAGSGFIMAPAVSNSTMWSSASQSAINSYVKTVGCVGICNGGTPPIAEFLGSPTTVCPNGSVNFTDQSSGLPTSWQWTFPGGTPSTSTLQNPVVVYKTTGIYDVTLKASNNFGSNTITLQKYIEVLPLVINAFTTFTIDRDLSTFNNCQNADSYLWKFGDGATSTEDEPMHTYTKDGTYTVELCATNTCGTVCKKQNIVIVTPVEANFIAEISDGCAPLKVKYKNLSSINSTAFKWEFPGGVPSVSVEKEPTITYNNKGIFDVKLTASNSKYSNVKYEKAFIRVDGKPDADYDSKAPLGNSIEFENKTIDTIRPWKYNWLWTFGDGKTSSERNPTHIFPGSGKYNVCLIVNNECDKDTLCKAVEISANLAASFSVNTAKGCTPLTVSFKNTSSGASKFKWEFPGGTPSTSELSDPVVLYNTNGSYDVKLTAFNTTDSVISNQKAFISVNSKPEGSFSHDVNKLVVKFHDETRYGSTYLWNFGDNSTSTEQNPEHTYKIEGEFDVVLTVTNECGETKVKQHIAVYLIPKVNFAATKTIICAGDYTQLNDLSSVDVKEWQWQIQGGTPAVSTEKNPRVLFEKQGTYSIKLSVKNSNGENSLIRQGYIVVKSPVFCPKHGGKNNQVQEGDNDDNFNLNKRSSEERDEQWTISPNPVANILTVIMPKGIEFSNQNLTIMDSRGHSLNDLVNVQGNENTLAINMSALSNGVYFLQFKFDDLSVIHKVAVVH